MKPYFFIIIPVLLWLGACKHKDQDPVPETQLKISLSHRVGNMSLWYDTLAYRNKAGETYSVSKLHYFISDIRFYNNNRLVFTADTVVYIDAEKGDHSLGVYTVSPFSYDSVACYIGVPPAHNEHGKLAPTYEHTAMEWPESMGGGYHFMKLEGHWQDTNRTPGYTVHLGKNPYLVSSGCSATGTLIAGQGHVAALEMDINEWFENPHTYSFQVDGSYTMNMAALMQKIAENGENVIGVKP